MSLINSFAEPVTITRSAAGAYVKGTWVPGTPTAIAMSAAVMPARPQETLHLIEGQRTRAGIKLYCALELKVADEAAGTGADEVRYQGRDYVVQSCEPWGGNLPHWKAIALLKEAPDAV